MLTDEQPDRNVLSCILMFMCIQRFTLNVVGKVGG